LTTKIREVHLASRETSGWAMSHTLGGQLTTDALAMALSQRGVPELVHSDRGSTCATALYLDLISKHGMRQSMSRKGNCWDNAPMESFLHFVKTELVMHRDYKTRDQARATCSITWKCSTTASAATPPSTTWLHWLSRNQQAPDRTVHLSWVTSTSTLS
jgi:transposase InsO family protein